MRNFFAVIVAIGLLSISGFSTEGNSAEEKAAQAQELTEEQLTMATEAAQQWLNLIDNSRYADSWTEAASYFQNNVTQEEWQQTLQGVRQPLGEVISRELESSQYTTSLPGAPDGEYVVIQYNTSFENKQSAIETVTLILDENGRWKVAGYYIK